LIYIINSLKEINFDQNFDSCQDENPDVFEEKILEQNIDFRPKYRFYIEMSNFWPQFRFLINILIFDWYFHFRPKISTYRRIYRILWNSIFNMSAVFPFFGTFSISKRIRFFGSKLFFNFLVQIFLIISINSVFFANFRPNCWNRRNPSGNFFPIHFFQLLITFAFWRKFRNFPNCWRWRRWAT